MKCFYLLTDKSKKYFTFEGYFCQLFYLQESRKRYIMIKHDGLREKGGGRLPVLDEVMRALSAIRAPQVRDEYDLHALAARALQDAGLDFVHEAPAAPRCRVDFLVGDTAVELKRGRPDRKRLLSQLTRYMASPKVASLILVSEKSCPLPDVLLGKPLRRLSLYALWGIAEDDDAAPGDPAQPVSAPAEEDLSFPEEAPRGAVTGGEEPDTEELPDFGPLPMYLDEEAKRKIPLPPYLLDSAEIPSHYYGTLSWNRRSRCWMIRGEAPVTEMAKRLWPGASGSRQGEARVPGARRAAADLNWLMLRYPLAVAPGDRERWAQALAEARDDYRQRETARLSPPLSDPPPAWFQGKLRHFQQEGMSFLIMTKRALLADEMGLGKTVQALAALASLRAFPALLVVPPHLVRNWESEIRRFLRVSGRLPRVEVVRGLTPYALPEADVYIVHYLLLRGWKKELAEFPFRAAVFDEIQELRRAGSEKYSAASLIAEKCGRVYGLSGTPIYNYGGEIWNVVNILDFHFLGDYEAFTREWCVGYGKPVVRHPEQLGEYLRREGLMLRRTKRQVLPELPAKRRLIQEIDEDDALYQQLMMPVWEKLYAWETDRSLTASQRSLLEDQISMGQRQATGAAKAPYVCQFVRALAEAGEKVLLFAHHHAVMDRYRTELRSLRPVFITGRESAAQKDEAVRRFMEGKTDLCCVSLRAASGLNLQRATCVVFGELDWSPAVHSQAEDRAHRIGQEDSLLCYYLVSPNGSDRDMQDALGLKVSQFEKLMGDHPLSRERQEEDAGYARRHVMRLAQEMKNRRSGG